MNYALIRYVVGWVVKIEGAFLLLPTIVGFIYKEQGAWYYLLVAALCVGLGTLLTRKKPVRARLYPKEGFVSVALSWIAMSILGAIPFVLVGDIPFYVDALFETISGFTTTGASILTEVEALSHAGLFWRSFTHWIGGMGVLVFLTAILPTMGASTMNLMKAESPGPSVDKLVPHVKDTAKILYGIYIAMTLIEIILLLLAGMGAFDALTTTFGTVGTGGFGIKNTSMAGYSGLIQNIVTVFMFLSGVNYVFYFYLITRKFRSAFKLEEVRGYFLVIFAAIVAICIDTRHIYTNIWDSLRYVCFQVVSIITTTGFATDDFDLWPQFSKTILIILMFVGACAGSTGGGIKVSRIQILFKTIKKELSLLVHPREVKKIRIDGHCVAHEVIRSTNVYMAIYLCVLFVSVLLIGIDEFGFTTNFTAVAATLNNIGPGMELVGPTQNFGIFSTFSKFVLMFDMLAGRLELLPMMILFAPGCWKIKFGKK
jgi:trk system potassium uptake protein TrkH